jgi:hypothetical protein
METYSSDNLRRRLKAVYNGDVEPFFNQRLKITSPLVKKNSILAA